MSGCKELCCGNSKTFKLTGSQVNLTPRSDKTILKSCSRKHRPCSAVSFYSNQTEQKTKFTRPKSAEYESLNSLDCKFLERPHQFGENNVSGNPSKTVSHYTDSSSKLLRNLLEIPNYKESATESSNTESYSKKSNDSRTETLDVDKCVRTEDNSRFLSVQKIQTKFPEEKTVRFSERDSFSENSFNQKEECVSFRRSKNCCLCSKSKLKSFSEVTFPLWEKTKMVKSVNQNINKCYTGESDVFENFCSINENVSFKEKRRNESEISYHEEKTSPKGKLNKNIEKLEKTLSLFPLQEGVEIQNSENKPSEKFESFTHSSEEEFLEEEYVTDEKDKNIKCNSAQQRADLELSEPTYEEIVDLLQTLEEDDSESLNSEKVEEADVKATTGDSSKEKIDYQNAVTSFLDEVDKECDSLDEKIVKTERWNLQNFTSPRLEELLNKNAVELAHEVFSLKIQIEDQKKGIKLLKETLSEMKEAKNVQELQHQEALNKVTSDAEALVQRHQCFIKQLLNKKKNLNETVSKLVQELKTGEEQYKRNVKAMEEKHLVEIKRAKEAQAVADKIKREKWMENKTQKIKEMTVKGLEPELSRMAAHQREEMTELRNLHKAELEAVELRAARRNSELMDELRVTLTKEKERAIAKETANLRANLEKDFENEKNKLQRYCESLKDRIRKQEEKLSNQEFEFQQRLLEFKQEEEKKRQKIIRSHEENLEEVRREHLTEIKNLKESMEAEKEVLFNNFKKQQAASFLEKEAELHKQYKKERDREIETVIELLEKESAQIQSDLNTANEGKLKRLKEKMEAEIQEIEASEAATKVKLTDVKLKLSEKEDSIIELNSQIRQLQSEICFYKKSCEEMTLEKSKIKEVIREEFESSIKGLEKQKENLEQEIVFLKEQHSKELVKKDQQNLQNKYEMQKELAKVYSRIKAAVSKKEKIIESLREENGATNQRCLQLEFMLDQQRRNLLLQ